MNGCQFAACWWRHGDGLTVPTDQGEPKVGGATNVGATLRPFPVFGLFFAELRDLLPLSPDGVSI